MSDRYVSRKGLRSEIYPKSSGQNATDEGQLPLPFTWYMNEEKTRTHVEPKQGYWVQGIRMHLFSTAEPTADDGEDGDLWFVYED